MMASSTPWSVLRKSLTIAAILFAFGSHAASAQPAGKMYRIGYLSGSFPGRNIRSLQRELHSLGYVEGKNVFFEHRHAEDKPERARVLADELVRMKVAVIVASGSAPCRAAMSATTTIPIVFLESVSDPASLGLVASLSHPGGNVTGFTTLATVLAGKRLEILKQTLPQIVRVAVLRNSQSADSDPQWRESLEVAPRIGLQLYSLDVQSPEGYENAFKEAIKAGNSGLAVLRHRLTVSYQKRLIDLAARFRLPTIYFREDFVQHGGFMSYGADEVEPFRRVAAMIDKILKGTKPADIPVEQPTKFELAINLKTAKQIGLTIPPHVLARADRVIR